MERERDRLVAARQRLIFDRRRHRADVRVGEGEYVGADDLERFQRIKRELELVQAALDATPPPAPVAAGDQPPARSGVDPAPSAATQNTMRAYGIDWREWTSWCAKQGEVALPARPDAIAAHVVELASRQAALATIERRLAAIGRRHRDVSDDLPPTRDLIVQRAMAHLRRCRGAPPSARRATLMPDELRRLVVHTDPTTLAGRRDRALLLAGSLLAVHRTQLVAIDVDDVLQAGRELTVALRRPGSRQGAEVRIVRRLDDVDCCPVVALLDWLAASGITQGAIWRRVTRSGRIGDRLSPQSVNLIVKRACARAGLDPARYGSDSLRPRRSR
jgi:hypothetical protein